MVVRKYIALALSALALVACDRADNRERVSPDSAAAVDSATTSDRTTAEREGSAGPTWPAGLKIIGDGYPSQGDSCRRLGETAATIDLLDHEAFLVGCPSPLAAAQLSGRVVGEIDGIVMVSIPSRAAKPGDGDGQGDAKVAGTEFNATGQIACAGYRKNPAGRCNAGIKRGHGKDISIIEIAWPDGGSRALFFNPDGSLLTANTAEADGSARYTPTAVRIGDTTVVTIGPERYEIPDAFLKGD
jgi:hypothetical protein